MADAFQRSSLRARTAAEFKAESVCRFFINSEDVGDIGSMISIAMLVGFGMTGFTAAIPPSLVSSWFEQSITPKIAATMPLLHDHHKTISSM